jgi:hypothetical protein
MENILFEHLFLLNLKDCPTISMTFVFPGLSQPTPPGLLDLPNPQLLITPRQEPPGHLEFPLIKLDSQAKELLIIGPFRLTLR